MKRTIQQWAKDAYDVQNACNLSGVVFAFQECLIDLAEEAARLGEGDDWICRHPIVVAWSDKLDDLSRSRHLPEVRCGDPLVGLVTEFGLMMRELCNLGLSTDERNEHPATKEFVRRIVAITESRDGTKLFNAFDECRRLAKGGE